MPCLKLPETQTKERCLNYFTIGNVAAHLLRDLESLKRKRHFEEGGDEDEVVLFATPRKRSIATSSRVYVQECIFCEKLKYVNRMRELIKATQLRRREDPCNIQ